MLDSHSADCAHYCELCEVLTHVAHQREGRPSTGELLLVLLAAITLIVVVVGLLQTVR
jgi:hypothetical protein